MKAKAAVDEARKKNAFIVDPLFPKDDEETRFWVFNSAMYTMEEFTEKEDGVEVTASIRPEDALAMGSDGGLFSLPPTGDLPAEAAKEFHAALAGMPKGKAKKDIRPPGGGGQEQLTAKTVGQRLHCLIDAVDKDITTLAKFIRVCSADADAADSIRQASEQQQVLMDAAVAMRSAEKEAGQKAGSEISEQFFDWSVAVTNPAQKWVDKNKTICGAYLRAQVPEDLRQAKKKKEKDPSASIVTVRGSGRGSGRVAMVRFGLMSELLRRCHAMHGLPLSHGRTEGHPCR